MPHVESSPSFQVANAGFAKVRAVPLVPLTSLFVTAFLCRLRNLWT